MMLPEDIEEGGEEEEELPLRQEAAGRLWILQLF